MNSKRGIIFAGLVVLALVISACSAVTEGLGAGGEVQPRTLSVAGSGKVFLTPDLATITIGVRTENADAGRAVLDNNAKAEEIASALKEMGVEEKDIQTSNFNIYANQQFDERGNPVSTTYVVENTVFVTVRDLSKLGELLGKAVEAGANQVYGIQFDVENKEEALSQARKAAVENARAKAEELAAAAGVTLGDIRLISEAGGFPVPVFEGKGGVGGGGAAEVPISPGELSLTVEVSVIFELK